MGIRTDSLAKQLCDLFGLKQCVSFSIHFELRESPYIIARVLVPDDVGGGLVASLKRYTLTEAPAPDEDDEPGGDIDWGDGGPLDAE